MEVSGRHQKSLPCGRLDLPRIDEDANELRQRTIDLEEENNRRKVPSSKARASEVVESITGSSSPFVQFN